MIERPLTILQVSQNYFVRGGSDRIFLETERLLGEAGHRVIPFTAASEHNQPSPWSDYFPRPADFEHPGPRDLARYVYSRPAARALDRLLREHPVDVAHLHIYYGKLTASILPVLRAHGVGVVQTLHEYKLICPAYTLISQGRRCEACRGRHFWRALPRKCKGSATRTALSVAESYASRWLGAQDRIDHYIAVSEALRQKVIAHGIPPGRICTVHNPIQAEPEANGSGADSGGRPYLLYFGRLERLKGVLTLLEAAERVPEIGIVIAGQGEARTEMERRIRRGGLDHVRLAGFQQGESLWQWVRGSLATLVPSQWHEPFPTTVLESFARGRPVIGSRIGGIPEMIEHEADGLLVDPGDPEGLARAMRQVASNPAQADRMGERGRQKIRARMGPRRYVRQILEIYERVGAGRGHPSPSRS